MATWTAPGCPGTLRSRQRHPHRGACRALPHLLQGHCTEGHVSPSRGLCILHSQPRPMSTPRLPAAKPRTPSTKGQGTALSPDAPTPTPRGPARQMPGEPSSDKRRESGPDAAAKLLERDFPQGGISFHFRPNELQFLSRHLPPMSSKLDKSHLVFPKSILLHSAPPRLAVLCGLQHARSARLLSPSAWAHSRDCPRRRVRMPLPKPPSSRANRRHPPASGDGAKGRGSPPDG